MRTTSHPNRTDTARTSTDELDAPLRIAVTGSTGLVGSRLVTLLRDEGHEVLRLVRRAPKADDEVFWNPDRGMVDATSLEGLDAVVHLAGVSIAGGLWTEKRKAAIRDSRVKGTRLLSQALAGLRQPPKVLVSTSAVGYYGDRGSERLTDTAPAGDGFLAEVVQEWESAAAPAAASGIRVVHPRFGVVLASEGGMLPVISMPFKFGVGGPIGGGQQYLSWIALDDLVRVLRESILNDELHGPLNAVAPNPVTNEEFSRSLARVLHRPSFFRTPATLMKIVGGQLVEELILVSQRAHPDRLANAGFAFEFAEIDAALRHVLGQHDPEPATQAASPARRAA